MNTQVRIRRLTERDGEVLVPTDISLGGIGFLSSKEYALDENVFVTLHYKPNSAKAETRGMIVRAGRLASSGKVDYGVKFFGPGTSAIEA